MRANRRPAYLSAIHIYWLSWPQGECNDVEAIREGNVRCDGGGNAVNGAAGVPSRLDSVLQTCRLGDASFRPAGGERSRSESRHAWTLWAHNDSGKPEIFSLDAKGTVTGRVSISGATLEDWEALASTKASRLRTRTVSDCRSTFRWREPPRNAAMSGLPRSSRGPFEPSRHIMHAAAARPIGSGSALLILR